MGRASPFPDMGVIYMAHRGPAGKSVKHGRTPNAEWTEVLDTPYTGPSPDLPKLTNRRKWNELVAQWYDQVRAMPHCTMWGPGDWMFAIETAMQKHEYYADDKRPSSAATEIRRRESMMGTTTEARRQLRIRYVSTADTDEDYAEPDRPVEVDEQDETSGRTVATVTPIAERRARLTRSA